MRKSRLLSPAINSKKCIIISNLALFWLKLNKMGKLYNSYEESLHLGVCKLAK